MDCETARLCLPFNRPRAGELDGADTAALEAHLASCPACAALGRAEQRLDQHLASAVRDAEIPVPGGLRDRVLARLTAERGDWYRRRAAWALRIGAAAAALFLAVWAWRTWSPLARPALDLAHVFPSMHLDRAGTAEEVDEGFARMGVKTSVPTDLNYAYLTNYALAELPGYRGKVVPQLQFQRRLRGRPYTAVVYVVSERDFDLRSLTEQPESDPGYTYKLETEANKAAKVGYLIFYTGNDLSWLRAPPAK
jgi:hypothetical protein